MSITRSIAGLAAAGAFGALVAVASQTAGAGARMAPAPARVATVDLVKVIERLNERSDWEVQITTIGKQVQEEFSSRRKGLEEMARQLDSAPESERQALRDKLAFEQLQFEQWERIKKVEIDRERALMWQSMYRNVRAESQKLADAEGWDVIMVNDGVNEIQLQRDSKTPLEQQAQEQIVRRRILFAGKSTDITDQLNSIQVNDCRMSQRLVTSLANDGNVLRDLWSEAAGEHAVGSSLRKNWQDFLEDTRADHGRPPDDTRALTEHCPDEFKAIFLGGSVLRNVAEELGLDDYADLMRGLVGDVVVSYRDSDRAYTVEVMGACPANDQLSPRDFMSGTVDEKRVDGRCSGAGLTAIADLVEDRLTAIAARIQGGSSAFTDEERGFIDQSPFNLLVLLRDAVQRGTTAETIAAIREPLAMAYAYRVLDDFYQAVQRVQEKAGEVEGNLRAPTADGGRCDATFLVQATTAVHDMAKRTISFRSLALANYHRAQQELATNMAVAAQQLADRRRSLNTLGAQGER